MGLRRLAERSAVALLVVTLTIGCGDDEVSPGDSDLEAQTAGIDPGPLIGRRPVSVVSLGDGNVAFLGSVRTEGSPEQYVVTGESYYFDTRGERWVEAPPLPAEYSVLSATAAATRDGVFVIARECEPTKLDPTDVHLVCNDEDDARLIGLRLDATSEEWTEIPLPEAFEVARVETPLPVPVENPNPLGSSAIYWLLTDSFGAVSDSFVLDTSKDTWTQLDMSAVPRSRNACVIGQSLFELRGGTYAALGGDLGHAYNAEVVRTEPSATSSTVGVSLRTESSEADDASEVLQCAAGQLVLSTISNDMPTSPRPWSLMSIDGDVTRAIPPAPDLAHPAGWVTLGSSRYLFRAALDSFGAFTEPEQPLPSSPSPVQVFDPESERWLPVQHVPDMRARLNFVVADERTVLAYPNSEFSSDRGVFAVEVG